MSDLRGRTVLVTGAGSGIGRAIADRFAADGATVVCADINLESASATAAALREGGLEAFAVEVDIADENSVARLVSTVVDTTGRIDIVAANAGIMVEGDILSLSLDDWNRAMTVNATGAFLTARATLPYLMESGQGTLVFSASTVALAGMRGVAAYSAAKGAIAALTRQIAADYSDRGVRANAVAPGAVRTPLSESQFRARARDDAHFDELLEGVIARYPIRRWGESPEIAEVVHFLGTSRSAWMTGQVLPVDGGLLELR
ncbi:SDR family NAD(P)-dependent oxidoreductase [Chromatocurvus halotolerans]|uniref:NAD(P)-dependent dehydrogenase (Short-subunit alcohol dehydrogenase family) n=1 Tax=Chromatocurvus halotolerans TaxID=1132028 RepID=A0A4R2KS87_9GAMM|nr:SDR family NAD(P)-dependent oxidoreductase [Chromatocurvus halotolerans]TCO76633.1 NAD(P)-dependent dehydrogenase (short-subunit alcohol dehydrogenase family) [Chromatocurvus halotolerans]